MFYNYSLNTIKKIIYIVLGALLILKILGADFDVFAVDYGYDRYSQTGYYYRYTNNDSEGYSSLDYFTSSDQVSYDIIEGTTDTELYANKSFSNGDVKTDYISKVRLRVYGSSTYVYSKENTYTMRFTFNFRYVQNNTNLNDDFLTTLQKFYRLKAYGNTSTTYSGSSSDYINNFSYYWKQGSVDGRYLLYVTFVPNEDLKYLSFEVESTGYSKTMYIDYLVYGSYNVSYLSVTYAEGINSVIENQTIIMQNNFDDIKEQFEDMMDILKDTSESTNDTIKDTNIDGAKGDADNFFSNFEDNDYGLSSVIKAPLSFINELNSGVCTPLTLPLPFVDTNVTLPCMTELYREHFPTFLDVYQLITTGLIAYGVCLNIFKKTKDFKNPENDKIEVMDL